MITLELGSESFSLDGQSISLRMAITTIEEDGLSPNETITSVLIDNKEFTLEEAQELMDYSLHDLGYPSLQIKNSYEVAFETLPDCEQYIDQLIDKTIITTSEFNKGNINEANVQFADLIELLDGKGIKIF